MTVVVDAPGILARLEQLAQSIYTRVANTGVPHSVLYPVYGAPASNGFSSFNPQAVNALSAFWGQCRSLSRSGANLGADPYRLAREAATLMVLADAVDGTLTFGVADPTVRSDWAECRRLVGLLVGPGGMTAAGVPSAGPIGMGVPAGAMGIVAQLDTQVRLVAAQARSQAAYGTLVEGALASRIDAFVGRVSRLQRIAANPYAATYADPYALQAALDECRSEYWVIDQGLRGSHLLAGLCHGWSTVGTLLDQLSLTLDPSGCRRRGAFEHLHGAPWAPTTTRPGAR